jgi:hypothetical protein
LITETREVLMVDYTSADKPSVLVNVFFPVAYQTDCPAGAFDLSVPVGEDATIVCRFHQAGAGWPWVLFFHGNGEVVSDYDDISTYFAEKGLNLVIADYRGYGSVTVFLRSPISKTMRIGSSRQSVKVLRNGACETISGSWGGLSEASRPLSLPPTTGMN